MEDKQSIIEILEKRFNENMNRHSNLKWDEIISKLDDSPEKLEIISRMEDSGGEPDVIGLDSKTGEYWFVDCSVESPNERRSVCYDQEALESRKKNKPRNSAVKMAAEIGVEILNEAEYKELQKLGEFDLKTSSWIKTPHSIRSLGGALFADRRFDTVFVYHNGADSYYAARGFRGILRV